MKIHIICGYFYPQLGPRSFRSTELVKEFIRCGHEVNVTIITETENFNHEAYAKKIGIKKWQNLKLYHKPAAGEKVIEFKKSKFKLKDLLVRFAEYLIDGNLFMHSIKLSQSLNIDSDTDMIIAISFPFQCVLGTSYYLSRRHFKKECVLIAESSDPHYVKGIIAPWFRLVDQKAYKKFDYLTVPVDIAIPAYTQLLPQEKIRVIPQGFNMQDIKLYKGTYTKPIKFAYSGSFLRGIRNPEFLFSFLDKQSINFEFHWFMLYEDSMFNEMLEKYPKLKSKTHKYVSVDRSTLLYELSRMDFLINIENLTTTQSPSKLIDYGIVKRPIFSCNYTNFSEQKMIDFLEGNYHDTMNVDISKYNIMNVSKLFMALYKEKQMNVISH